MNLVYALTSKSNLRASYSQTVSRPEFRELAAFSFFDFNDNLLVEGNQQLKRTKINNFEFLARVKKKKKTIIVPN